MTLLTQSKCKALAEALFGTECKLYVNGLRRQCIAVKLEGKDNRMSYQTIGIGIGWEAALEDAKKTAQDIIQKMQKEEDKVISQPTQETK